MLLLIISFLAGALTVLAPCVLPVLPVMVSGSIGEEGDHLRPYVIAVSLALSIVFFTLILKVSTLLVNLPASVITDFSGGLLIALGLISAVPEAWEYLMIRLNLEAASQRFLSVGEHNAGAYTGPVLIGVALGPVFASCSPTYAFILASVLPVSFLAGTIYLSAYAIGLVLTVLGVALIGRKYISRFSWAINTHSLFRRSLGLIFILFGLAFITGYEIQAETWVASHLPFDEARIEQVLLSTQTKHPVKSPNKNDVLNVDPYPAPELAGLTNWINSPPLTISQLQGKVVLVDFWTYSCINCLRTLPYIEKWYAAYHSKGLVIIGVNTPEFAFEHNPANVARAVKKQGILYPVALDNNYETWNAFQNSSWPADYLIDQSGQVRYVSIGEGDYTTTERAIQYLLGINQPLTTGSFTVPISENQTPETYFGTNREQSYVGTTPLSNGTGNFKPASSLGSGDWTLSGRWQISGEQITSKSSNSKLTINVDAKDVYTVAASASSGSETATVSLPGSDKGQFGTDAPNGSVVINSDQLYHIVSLHQFGSTTITLTVPAGVSLYTFTFGS